MCLCVYFCHVLTWRQSKKGEGPHSAHLMYGSVRYDEQPLHGGLSKGSSVMDKLGVNICSRQTIMLSSS